LVTAAIVVVVYLLAEFVLPIAVPMLMSRVTGSGGIGVVVVDSHTVLGFALFGFIAGFAAHFLWRRRRAHARR
jgi:hypothetical protein